MSDTPLADAIKKVKALPSKELEAGLVVNDGDIGGQARVSVPLGKGWGVGAMAQYMRETKFGAAVAVWWKVK
jgi:hypothetical protein